MKYHKVLILILLCALIVVPRISQAAGPQDQWYYVTNYTGFSSPMGMALGTNGYIFVAETGANQIRIIDTDGSTITNWTGFSGPRDVAVSTNGMVYVCDSGNNMIKVFDHAGSSVTSWGAIGTNSGEFSSPTTIGLLDSGRLVVADGGNYRIQVFEPDGTFVRKWGSSGVFDGQFRAAGIEAEIGADGLIYVNDTSESPVRIQRFNEDGLFINYYINNVTNWLGGNGGCPTLSRGLQEFYFSDVVGSGARGCYCHDHISGTRLFQLSGGRNAGYALETGDGKLFYAYGGAITVYERYYRHRTYNPDANNDVPIPVVSRAEQRPGTAWMDIDYIVYDGNDSNVTAGVLAFANSGTSLNDIIRPTTFEENTSTNIGLNIKTGVKHHLTWNVAADWSTNYSPVQIEILARDTRDLMDFQFITIPSNGVNPELTINKSALNPAELLHIWMWLIAIDDPDINLISGSVIGQTGTYTGKTLASGTSTTADGTAFLFERLNVVEASTAEKDQAVAARAIGGGESTYWVKPKP